MTSYPLKTMCSSSLYRGDFFAILKGSAARIKAKASSLKDTDLNFVSALPYGDASFTSIAALGDKIAVISSDGVVNYSPDGGQNFKRSHQIFPFVKVIRFIPDGTIVFGNEPPETPIVIFVRLRRYLPQQSSRRSKGIIQGRRIKKTKPFACCT